MKMMCDHDQCSCGAIRLRQLTLYEKITAYGLTESLRLTALNCSYWHQLFFCAGSAVSHWRVMSSKKKAFLD